MCILNYKQPNSKPLLNLKSKLDENFYLILYCCDGGIFVFNAIKAD